ncbi:CEPT1 [Branchiostoma lanceolatum]|uniref:CEPT1 protein n=1 Tax=Branchiostoma lanceolatum TaxID=7740 RepID=A0A8K0ELN9_BRALA|nr:CEPT1 [Branchiostoma lanceolatum]
MVPVLSEAQLKRLEEHKYSVSGVSVTERVLQVLWSWLVERLPMWVAPNLLTMAGFVINVVTSLMLICYAPTAKEEAPVWVYMSCAVGWFLYQCLDGMDGKQARRTGSSTPLGELFDHGSDAISSVFLVMATGCAMKIGEMPALQFGMLFAALVTFYSVHWDACMCGTVQVPLFPVSRRVAAIAPLIFVGLSRVCYILWTALTEDVDKDNTTTNNNNNSAAAPRAGHYSQNINKKISRVFSTGFPIFYPVSLACIIYGTSSSHLFLDHPCLYLLMFGLAIAKVSNKLIVSHITKSEMTMLDSSMFGPGVLLLRQCCGGFIFVTMDLALYCCTVCEEICDHLDIYFFNITSKPSQRRH